MSKNALVLIAAHVISGGVRGKDGTIEPFAVAAGEEMTAEVVRKLGLDDAALARLQETGAVVEESVRAAEPGEDVATLETQLAAERKRADDAEAKVAALEKQVADQKKAPAA